MCWKRTCKRVSETTGGLTPPALALLCECPPAKNDFCGGQTQVQPRAATVSPPWVLGKCTCRNAAAKSRETAIGAFTNPGAVAVAKPRGAYAPPLLVARCWFAGEMAIFPIRERIFTGAAGVSPPLFGHPGVVRSELRNVRRLANTESRAAGVSPPWFGHPGVVRPELRDVRRLANTESRAATVSPPWFDNTIGTAADFFGLNTFLHRTFGFPHHGGLTPPALALLCECPPAKNDFCGGQTQVQPRAAGVSPP
jgi:hypothetical protein